MKPKIILNVDYLNYLQEKKEMSDSDLAKEASLNVSQIWRVKKGRSNPGPKFIVGVLNAFPDQKFNNLFFLISPLQAGQDNLVVVGNNGTEGN